MKSPLCSRSPHCRGAQGPPSRAFCLRLDPRTAGAAGPPLSRPRSCSHAVGIGRGSRPWDQGEGLLSAHSAPSELAPLSPTALLAPEGGCLPGTTRGDCTVTRGSWEQPNSQPASLSHNRRPWGEGEGRAVQGRAGWGARSGARARCQHCLPWLLPRSQQRRGGWGPARALV